MKNLTHIFNSENLTPKERIMLLAKNDIAIDTKQKNILTKEDIIAVTETWKPKHNFEVREYNRYLEGWRIYQSCSIDMQTAYLLSQVDYYKTSKLLDIACLMPFEEYKDISKSSFKFDTDEPRESLLKNSGIEYHYLIYRMTWDNLSDEIKSDLLVLSPDSETEMEYLNEEEILYNQLNSKKELTESETKQLTHVILETMHWDKIDIMQERGNNASRFLFDVYFGGLPLIEVFKKWAEYECISYENIEGLKCIVLEKGNVKEILRKTLIQWIKDGLFTKEFIPLFMSTDTSTCNGVDTKKTHSEVFMKWLSTKKEQKAIIDKHVKSGELIIKTRVKKIGEYTEAMQIISGTSIYNLENDYLFKTSFKSSIDEFLYLAVILHFLEKREFIKTVQGLLSYEAVLKKVGTIYEVNTLSAITEFKEKVHEEIDFTKFQILLIFEKIEEYCYLNLSLKYITSIFLDDMFNVEKILKPEMSETVDKYEKAFKEVFREEW